MPTTPKFSDASIERSAVTGDDGADTLRFPKSESESPATPMNAKAVPQVDGSVPTMLPAGVLLDQLPDGAALLNHEFRILWCNRQLREFTAQGEAERKPPIGPKTRSEDSLLGKSFYEAFGAPEIIGPDFCPLHTALGSGELAKSSLRVGEKTYLRSAGPRRSRRDESDGPNLLVVSVRDISAEVLQRQKLNAIYQAGLELGDLSLQDILQMSVSERIDLLKSKILHYTQDLLQFGTVEIRLLDKSHETTRAPVGRRHGSRGRQPRAAGRPARQRCDGVRRGDRQELPLRRHETDPLYLPGAAGSPQLAHRAADSARRNSRHLQRREPQAGRLQRERSAVPRILLPGGSRRHQHV